MPQLLHLSRQQQADFELVTTLSQKFAKTGNISSDEKVVLGIVIKRIPDSWSQKKQLVALYSHLMANDA